MAYANSAGAAYIPMPKGRGFTPHFGNLGRANAATFNGLDIFIIDESTQYVVDCLLKEATARAIKKYSSKQKYSRQYAIHYISSKIRMLRQFL